MIDSVISRAEGQEGMWMNQKLTSFYDLEWTCVLPQSVLLEPFTGENVVQLTGRSDAQLL